MLIVKKNTIYDLFLVANNILNLKGLIKISIKFKSINLQGCASAHSAPPSNDVPDVGLDKPIFNINA